MPTSRLVVVVVVLVVALGARASSARAISREDAFVGYSERARRATLRLTLDGDPGDARAIALRLREDWAPTLARELAGGAARGGSFYRAEATPEAGARDGYGGPGPPYALLQGAMEGLRGKKAEGEAPIVARGYACVIGTGPDFFIATRGHAEWGRAHACFAEASEDSMALVDEITETYAVHPETWGRTNVTVLNERLPFSASIE